MTEEDGIPPDVINVIHACHEHAEDLVRSAKRVLQEENLPNVAYHLTALALEEIGKAEIIGAGHMAFSRDEYVAWPGKSSDDHVKKLFWALWTPSLGREAPTNQSFETFQGIARQVHENRLRGLYVDVAGGGALPKNTIPKEMAEQLLSLVAARLGLAKSWKPRDLGKEEKEMLKWFISATEDPQKRNLVMGQKSMEKLVELKGIHAWIAWLKEQFDKADTEARQRVEDELKRPEPSGDEAMQGKWQMTVRLHSLSHTIKQKPLNWWNDGVTWMRLQAVDQKKNQLLVTFTLPKGVPIQGLWWAGWGAARWFVAALNIGSMGYFWWYVPEQTSRFYEKLRDLEMGGDLAVERNPELKLDFKRGLLTEDDIRRVSLCFTMVPGPDRRDQHEPFDHYIAALAYWGKNDIHVQFEAQVFLLFFKSLKAGMRQYGDWDGTRSFGDAFHPFMKEWFPKVTSDDRTRYITFGERLEAREPLPGPLTLEEVGVMKAVCDAYFIRVFSRLADERRKQEASDGIASS